MRIKDPNDDPIVHTALAGQADVLCSGDKHFYGPSVLSFCSRYRIRLMSEVELLKRFGRVPFENWPSSGPGSSPRRTSSDNPSWRPLCNIFRYRKSEFVAFVKRLILASGPKEILPGSLSGCFTGQLTGATEKETFSVICRKAKTHSE